MDRFKREVNGTRGQAEARATVVMRQFLVDYVNRYRADGALGRYVDGSRPVDVAAEFRDLVLDDPGVPRYFEPLAGLEHP